MAREQLLTAHDLIQQKRYDEARSLLKTIDHPKAREWLQKLDEIAPEAQLQYSATAERPNARDTELPRQRGGILTSAVLFALIAITLTVVVYGTFLRSPEAAQAEGQKFAASVRDELNNRLGKIEDNLGQVNGTLITLTAPTATPSITPTVLPTPTGVRVETVQRWKYLTVEYEQIAPTAQEQLAGLSDFMVEFGSTSDPTYKGLFDEANNCYETLIKARDPFKVSDSELKACSAKVKGMAYYLNVIGQDGWELVSLADKSTQSSYRVEMIFRSPTGK